MSPAHVSDGDDHIIYDPTRVDQAGGWLFEPEHYRLQGTADVQAMGRGNIVFLQLGEDQWVLRQYGRSGLPASLGIRRYWWTGLRNSRPWREFHILAKLHDAGFSVPAPIAARVQRKGFTYAGALITERLRNMRPLADWLMEAPLPEAVWRDIGALAGRLHARRVHHTDLNITNLLLDAEHRVHMIDFDNARESAPSVLLALGMRRFRRSFRKAVRERPVFHYDDRCWQWLMQGYLAARQRRG
jgi:3-deoxy-D-manno-octulosonic acid kinase